MDANVPALSCMVIDFRTNGEVEAMHRDTFNLAFLGKQSIKRASDIRYDEATQDWAIFVAVGEEFQEVPEARGFETYEEARKMEVRWFEYCRLHSLAPLALEGIAMLNVLRKKFD